MIMVHENCSMEYSSTAECYIIKYVNIVSKMPDELEKDTSREANFYSYLNWYLQIY